MNIRRCYDMSMVEFLSAEGVRQHHDFKHKNFGISRRQYCSSAQEAISSWQEWRNPSTISPLLEVIDKYKNRMLRREVYDSSRQKSRDERTKSPNDSYQWTRTLIKFQMSAKPFSNMLELQLKLDQLHLNQPVNKQLRERRQKELIEWFVKQKEQYNKRTEDVFSRASDATKFGAFCAKQPIAPRRNTHYYITVSMN